MADFPTSKKTWADLVDNSSPANSSDINSAYAEITAIEDAFLTDSTSLDASTDLHGFLPKLSGSSDEYMNGIGEWGTPASGGGASSDLIEHGHTGSTDGGAIKLDALQTPDDSTSLDASTDAHGLLPKLDGSSDNFLNGLGAFAKPRLDLLDTPADTTSLDASTDAHGLLLKLDGTSDNYLNGKGEWWNVPLATATVAGKVYGLVTSDFIAGTTDANSVYRFVSQDDFKALMNSATTDFDASTDTHGFLPKLSGTSDEFMNGKGEWGTATASVATATTDTAGVKMLAGSSDITAGTTDNLMLATYEFAHSDFGKRGMIIKLVDDASALAIGDGKVIVPIPREFNGMNLVDAHAAITTAGTSDTATYQIRNVTDSADMLSTLITIDATEYTSYSAVTQPVIDAAHDDVATGDLIAVDKDVTAAGSKGDTVILVFQLP